MGLQGCCCKSDMSVDGPSTDISDRAMAFCVHVNAHVVSRSVMEGCTRAAG
jgi:hypothetical protein